ncbi:MAG: hypothetical protein OD815_000005 [Candidatus Alkanophagales archaeon MCA70_species_2]|nr:hypothetical protein [Candidatus Alkanophaga liquidiphilum]
MKRSDFHLDIIEYGAYEEEYKRLANCLVIICVQSDAKSYGRELAMKGLRRKISDARTSDNFGIEKSKVPLNFAEGLLQA